MPTPFSDLLERVRAGDERAAEELVRKYEPMIRVTIRARLQDSRLRRVMDSMDICQSVMASFFTRASLGEFDLEEPNQLIGLLVKMAKHKVISQGRREHSEKRDVKRLEPGGSDRLNELSGMAEPGRIVEGRELVAIVRSRLKPEEAEIAERRGAGQSWQEVAEGMGGTAEARRKQFGRALARVLREVGLEEGDDNG